MSKHYTLQINTHGDIITGGKNNIKYRVRDEFGGKELVYSNVYDKEKRVCGFCGDPVKLDIRYVFDEDTKIGKLVNIYEPYCCGSKDCPSYKANGRSYEWLTKARKMSESEALDFQKEIGSRSGSTAKTRRNAQGNKNKFSKQYWIDKGLTEEEANYKINSRNRRRIEFWLERGYEKKNAENMAKFHSSTNTLEYLMWFKGYDKKSAEEILKEKHECLSKASKFNVKIHNSLRKGSKTADDFFYEIFQDVIKQYDIKEDDIYTESFGKCKEWFCRASDGIVYYDFCIPCLGLIIEYHGVHVHPKQRIQEDWKHAFSKSGSDVVWDRDKKKERLAKEKFDFDLYFVYYSDDNVEDFKDRLLTELGTRLETY